MKLVVAAKPVSVMDEVDIGTEKETRGRKKTISELIEEGVIFRNDNFPCISNFQLIHFFTG